MKVAYDRVEYIYYVKPVRMQVEGKDRIKNVYTSIYCMLIFSMAKHLFYYSELFLTHQ